MNKSSVVQINEVKQQIVQSTGKNRGEQFII